MNRIRLSSIGLLAVVLAVALGAQPPNLAETLALQRQLASERPGDADVWNDLGNLLVLAGEEAEAEAAYRKALEVDPTIATARFNLGLLLQERGARKDAETIYRDLVELWPDHARAHYQLGAVLESRGRRREAVEHYGRAFALEPRLSFPGTNAHVLESELVTESLLYAGAHEASLARTVPRDYEEPGRIQHLMLETSRREAAAVDEPIPLRPEGRGEIGERSGDPTAAGEAVLGPRNPMPLEDAEGPDLAGEDGLEPDEERRRVTGDELGGRDVGGGVVGIAPAPDERVREVPSRVRRPTGRPETPSRVERPGDRDADPPDPADEEPEVRRPGRLPPPVYRPGRNSTGRLDLRLLPTGPGAGDDESRVG